MFTARRPALLLILAFSTAAFAQYLAPAPRLDPSLYSFYENQAPRAKALSPLTVDRFSRAASQAFYNTVYVPTTTSTLGWTGTVSPCVPGATSVAFRDATLDRVNYFRAMAGLPGNVTFNAGWDSTGQATALIMTAQNDLSHSPPLGWACYSGAGATGAGESNIALGSGGGLAAGPGAIKLYMDDFFPGNEIVGHRRWILYPPQANMGTGSTGNGAGVHSNALRTFGAGVHGSRPATPNGVAWPPAGFVPYQILPWNPFDPGELGRWSFSYENANFAAATVTVNGVAIPGANIISRTVNGYGDNTIVWRMNVPPNAPASDTDYNVVVAGIGGGGPASFSYTVTVFNPAVTIVAPRQVDTNGDGRNDILWRDGSNQLSLWQMNGTAVSSSALLLGASNWQATHGRSDFNGDGRSDVLFRNTDGSVSMWLMNGTTVQSSAIIFGANAGWTVTHAADLNGDGRADLVWRNTDGSASAWLMNGISATSSGFLLPAGSPWTFIHTGDFNNDGRQDLVLRHTDGSIAIWLMDGLTVTSGSVVFGPSATWTVTHVADFNGDGRSDLLFRNSATGEVSMWLMNGAAVSNSGTIFGGDPGWQVAHVGDTGNDLRADLVWRHTNGQVAVWTMNGLAPTASALIFGGDPGWTVASLRDFDGDGRMDVLWRHTDGRVAVWTMNGTAITGSTLIFGGSGGWLVAPAP